MRAHHAGFSLLEVLIALVVLSIGLLGIAGLLARTLKSTDSSYMQTVATTQAYDIIERMQANPNAVSNMDYVHMMPAAPAVVGTVPHACTGGAADCNPSQLASYDIAQWEYQLAQRLPLGRGAISTTVTPTATTYTVTVTWNDSRANVGLVGADGAHTTTFSVTSG